MNVQHLICGCCLLLNDLCCFQFLFTLCNFLHSIQVEPALPKVNLCEIVELFLLVCIFRCWTFCLFTASALEITLLEIADFLFIYSPTFTNHVVGNCGEFWTAEDRQYPLLSYLFACVNVCLSVFLAVSVCLLYCFCCWSLVMLPSLVLPWSLLSGNRCRFISGQWEKPRMAATEEQITLSVCQWCSVDSGVGACWILGSVFSIAVWNKFKPACSCKYDIALG